MIQMLVKSPLGDLGAYDLRDLGATLHHKKNPVSPKAKRDSYSLFYYFPQLHY